MILDAESSAQASLGSRERGPISMYQLREFVILRVHKCDLQFTHGDHPLLRCTRRRWENGGPFMNTLSDRMIGRLRRQRARPLHE